ncbi:TIGR03620 family F420-dependent LLM class oxidoreductase [Paractinoplanes globisporus]|uniref:TIGR03620 family F420-dependent LLM class oxidoreductase n=1 Tax=Paractinoplanes globisporus TaxID=113565 RepID=A0ABW6WWD4_9ACTN|nr:TIGR03620 family F420-dependent LLM class oxidoreductase [Actinoplanes globisporus]
MTATAEIRQALGRLGIWMPPMPALGLDPAQFGKAIEAAGFRSVWFPEVNSPQSLEPLAAVLAATGRLIVGTGIASVWTWDPADLASRADRLSERYPGRFILGLGNSHARMVESLGQAYEKPYSKMVQFLDAFPPTRTPVVLAALGPKMLRLARERALGAHPYFVPPGHTAFARRTLGPEPLLIPEVAVALAPGAEGEASARTSAKYSLQLPNYTSNLKRLGFTDEDLGNDGSPQLIKTIIPYGPQPAAERIRQHLGAGADHVVVQPLGEGGNFAPADLEKLAALVPDLLS